jgi:hypothetical protein
MRTSACYGILVPLLLVGLSGCIVDDTGGSRGQPNAPSASVPDSGSPVRRESAADTLNDARERAPGKAEGTLDVEGRVNE